MPSNDRTAANGTLPADVHSATAGYVNDNLAAWDSRIAQMREALQASGSADFTDKPMFLEEAEETARKRGCPVQEVLQSYSAELAHSMYPTPECFLIDEIVEHLRLGPIPEERLRHVEKCEGCTTLLNASLPTDLISIPGPIDDLLFRSPTSKVIAKDRSWKAIIQKSWFTLPEPARLVITGWLAMIVPAVVVLAGTYFFLLSLNRRATALTIPANDYFWIVTIAGSLACLIVCRGFRSFPRLPLVATGCVLGLVCGLYLIIDYRDSQAMAAMTFDWAQTKAEQFAIKAIEQKQSTDTFPDKARATAFFESGAKKPNAPSVEISESSEREAKYVVTIPKLPAKILAEVQAATGKITIDDGDKKPTEMQFVLGTIEADAQSPINKLIIADKGGTYKVQEGQNAPGPGTRVIALVDPQESSFARVVSTSFLPRRRSGSMY